MWGSDGSDPFLQYLVQPHSPGALGPASQGSCVPPSSPLSGDQPLPACGRSPQCYARSCSCSCSPRCSHGTAQNGTASLCWAQLPCAGQAAPLMPISSNGKLQSHSFPSGLMGTAGITRLLRPSRSDFPAAQEPAGSRATASFPGRQEPNWSVHGLGKQFIKAG